jgi:hypothetical protein
VLKKVIRIEGWKYFLLKSWAKHCKKWTTWNAFYTFLLLFIIVCRQLNWKKKKEKRLHNREMTTASSFSQQSNSHVATLSTLESLLHFFNCHDIAFRSIIEWISLELNLHLLSSCCVDFFFSFTSFFSPPPHLIFWTMSHLKQEFMMKLATSEQECLKCQSPSNSHSLVLCFFCCATIIFSEKAQAHHMTSVADATTKSCSKGTQEFIIFTHWTVFLYFFVVFFGVSFFVQFLFVIVNS